MKTTSFYIPLIGLAAAVAGLLLAAADPSGAFAQSQSAANNDYRVIFKHSSDLPSNSRAEYLFENSAIDPGGSSYRTIIIELQKW